MSFPSYSYYKYLTSNEADINWGLYITDAGSNKIPPGSSYPFGPHPESYCFHNNKGRILQEYEIVYITQGEGVFESQHADLKKITGGTIFFLFPDEWHSYAPTPEIGWDEYWVGFKGEFADHIFNNGFFQKSQPFYEIGPNDLILSVFQQIIENAKEENPGYQQITSGLVIQLMGLIHSADKYSDLREEKIEQLIMQAKFMFHESIEVSITPKDIADRLNIGYSLFRKTFKQYTGLAPLQYLMQLRLQKAKDLLNNTLMPVKEIAFLLKFDSYYYFTHFFKEKTGMSPSDYRRLCMRKT